MHPRNRTLVSALAIIAVMVFAAYGVSGASGNTLRKGDKGDNVYELQEYLSLSGHLTTKVDGLFGDATLKAVMSFQKASGLTPDGIVGAGTWKALIDACASATRSYTVVAGDTMYSIAKRFGTTVDAIASASGVSKPESIRPGQKLEIPMAGSISRSALSRGGAELVHWDEAKRIFTHRATIVDCVTGLSFDVQRRGGSNHADAEPLTSEDTATMKRIYGGKWSWSRHAVVVVVGDRRMAASINGFPHGGAAIANNSFPGHFCVHFLGSRTHASASSDPDHQRMVQAAVGN